MDAAANSKATPSPEQLEAVASVIERAAIGLIGVHGLLLRCDDDEVGQPARFAVERVVQMLDSCIGALTDGGRGPMGNFRPEDDIAQRERDLDSSSVEG